MNLTDEAAAEFQAIYQDENKKTLTLDEAREYGSELLELMKMFVDNEQQFTNLANINKG
jgi:hypothetical protein